MSKLVYFVLLTVLISCGEKPLEKTTVRGQAFGTTFSIQAYTNQNIDLEKGIDSILNLVNKSVSTYLPDSDISKINRGDTSVIVDQIFIDNFNLSSEVYQKTEGYFDPTIGVLRNAYGFGDIKPLKVIDTKALDSMLNYVGFHKVKLTEESKIWKEYPEIYFDFNAVAKGYGIDLIGDYLVSNKIQNFLIELGGELLAKGVNLKKNKTWLVGIENSFSTMNDRSYSTSIMLKDIGMATSGNYRKFRVDSISKKRYVHTLNPLTGSAEKSNITSATVLASSCAKADAYATSFMALGFEKSVELINELDDIEVYLTYNDQDNIQQFFVTEGMKKIILD
jgi:thiamine biosynthesis lipoprotein